MTKLEFHNLLTHSTNSAFDFAKKYVTNDLPNNYKYIAHLNISNDNTNLKQFDIYPEDDHKITELISSADVVELLFRDNKVPVWIDISVEYLNKENTIFRLLCAGRYSSDSNEFYYSKQGTGPFGIKSPVFPPDYKNDGSKFSLKSI